MWLEISMLLNLPGKVTFFFQEHLFEVFLWAPGVTCPFSPCSCIAPDLYSTLVPALLHKTAFLPVYLILAPSAHSSWAHGTVFVGSLWMLNKLTWCIHCATICLTEWFLWVPARLLSKRLGEQESPFCSVSLRGLLLADLLHQILRSACWHMVNGDSIWKLLCVHYWRLECFPLHLFQCFSHP